MKKIRFSLLSIFVILIIIYCCISNIRWKNDEWKNIIVSDGYGYYAYLPALFIYHDLQYNAVYEHEKKVYGNTTGYYIGTINGKNINRYFAGEATLLSPFFFIAHLLTKFSNGEADGFSEMYQKSVSIGALFYLFIGLWFLRKLLQEYNIKEGVIAITLFLFAFSTNLFHYVVSEPAMSHVYSFAMVSAFMFYIKKSVIHFQRKYILWAAVALSFVCLLRPSNLLIIALIPFLAGSFKELKSFLSKLFISSKRLLLTAMLLFIVIVSIQPILYWAQVGKPFVYSYLQQTFDFTKPEIINILFSYRKGLFIYTPILLISMLSFIVIWNKNKYQFITLFAFIFIMIYIISSWFMWYYGASFGMRAIIDFYPVFALMFALFLNEISGSWIRYPIILISVLFLGINQVQTYQYRNYILEGFRMSKFKYWKVFLKTDKEYAGLFYHNIFYDDIEGTTLKDYKINYDGDTLGWESLKGIQFIDSASGNKSQKLDSNNIYGATLVLKKEDYLFRNVNLVIKVRLKTFFDNALTKASIVVSIDSASKTYFYKTAKINELIPIREKQWQEFCEAFKLPFITNKADIVKVYVLFEKGQPFYIDDFEVEVVDATIW